MATITRLRTQVSTNCGAFGAYISVGLINVSLSRIVMLSTVAGGDNRRRASLGGVYSHLLRTRRRAMAELSSCVAYVVGLGRVCCLEPV